MTARVLLRILERQPLSYRVVRQAGSHRRMRSASYPPLTYAFHASYTVAGGVVRKILVRDVGLSEAKAGATYEECHKLAEEGVRFALERDDVSVEHYVPADERVSA